MILYINLNIEFKLNKYKIMCINSGIADVSRNSGMEVIVVRRTGIDNMHLS